MVPFIIFQFKLFIVVLIALVSSISYDWNWWAFWQYRALLYFKSAGGLFIVSFLFHLLLFFSTWAPQVFFIFEGEHERHFAFLLAVQWRVEVILRPAVSVVNEHECEEYCLHPVHFRNILASLEFIPVLLKNSTEWCCEAPVILILGFRVQELPAHLLFGILLPLFKPQCDGPLVNPVNELTDCCEVHLHGLEGFVKVFCVKSVFFHPWIFYFFQNLIYYIFLILISRLNLF